MERVTLLTDKEANEIILLLTEANKKLRMMDQGTGAFIPVTKPISKAIDMLSVDKDGNWR